MKKRVDPDVDIDYLKDCLKLTAEERFIRCAEFSEFCAEINPYHKLFLERDHPEVYELK